jgi:hypothetical protein
MTKIKSKEDINPGDKCIFDPSKWYEESRVVESIVQSVCDEGYFVECIKTGERWWMPFQAH